MRTLLVAGVAAAVLAVSPAQSETRLVFNQWVPPTHHYHARILKPWAERVEAETQGRVKIEFTASSLGAPQRQFELARTGVCDLAAGNQAYTPDRFQLAQFAELPFLSQSAEALSVANWRVTEKYLKEHDEYEGTKLLAVFSNGGAMVFTRQKPIASLADLEGLKLRAAGGMPTDVARRLGGVPVGAPITEALQMLSRGIVDGTLLPPDSINSFKLYQHLGHMTQMSQGLFSSTFFVVMNEGKWNTLSQQDRDAIMRVSGEDLARKAGAIWDDQDRIAVESFRSHGVSIHEADEAFYAAARDRLAPIEAEWLELAAKKGVDGHAILDETRAIVAGYRASN